MKVIKPLNILSNNRLLYTNALDTAAAWSSATAYVPSTLTRRTVVFYNGEFWECLKSNTNSAPSSVNTNWTSLGSSIPELPVSAAVTAWNSAVTYNVDTVVSYGNYYYTSLQNSNLNRLPTEPGTVWWSETARINSQAQFDTQVSTSTYGNRILTATTNTEKINSISIINPVGRRATITCKNATNDSGTWKTFNNSNSAEPEYDASITEALYAIAYNPADNVLVVGGGSGKISYSTNAGQSWTQATTPNATDIIRAIAYSFELNMFVAAGSNSGSTDPVVWSSLDGVTWTARTIPSIANDDYLNCCTYIADDINKFFTAGDSGIFYSSDAITWTRTSLPVGIDEIKDIAYRPTTKTITAVGVFTVGHPNARGIIASTDGGLTWQGPAGTSTTNFNSLVYVEYEDFFVAAADNAIYRVLGGVSSPGIALLTGTFPVSNYQRVIAISNSQSQLTANDGPTYIAVGKTRATGAPTIVKFNISGTTAAINIQEISPTIPYTTNLNNILYDNTLDSVFIVGDNGRRIRSSITYFNSQLLNVSPPIGDWYDYFFADYEIKNQILLNNVVPNYTGTKTTFSIVADPEGTNYVNKYVSASVSLAGNQIVLGTTQWGASAGILDYSKKETDDFGTTTFVERAFSKRMNVNLILPSADLTRVQKALIDIRATPCMWIGTDDSEYDVLVIYGFYRDFNLEIPYPEYSFCSLQIEGLT